MENQITDSRLLLDYIKKEVSKYYDDREAGSITYLLLEHFFSLTKNDVIVKKPLTSEVIENANLPELFKRIKAMEPIQYIIGAAHCYGATFAVGPAVLIPRPETEELIDLIVRENQASDLHILDIGTGSGCIAICLRLHLENPTVYGLDISSEALQVAERNALQNNVEVHFTQADILKEEPAFKELDIIVSNPPYVRKKESKLMKQNVLKYEPNEALFVPDKDPLLFYKKIIEQARMMLKNEGKLYFEINEAYGQEIKDYMMANNFSEVTIFEDFQGKERMIRGQIYLP